MFHVGQMVVCVDDSEPLGVKDSRLSAPLRKGAIYTIREILGEYPFITGVSVGVRIEEIVRFHNSCNRDHPFGAARFRPVRQTSIEQFTSILNQAPQREDA